MALNIKKLWGLSGGQYFQNLPMKLDL